MTGNVPLNPIPNSSIFSAVVAENCMKVKKNWEQNGKMLRCDDKIVGFRFTFCPILPNALNMGIGIQMESELTGNLILCSSYFIFEIYRLRIFLIGF